MPRTQSRRVNLDSIQIKAAYDQGHTTVGALMKHTGMSRYRVCKQMDLLGLDRPTRINPSTQHVGDLFSPEELESALVVLRTQHDGLLPTGRGFTLLLRSTLERLTGRLFTDKYVAQQFAATIKPRKGRPFALNPQQIEALYKACVPALELNQLGVRQLIAIAKSLELRLTLSTAYRYIHKFEDMYCAQSHGTSNSQARS